MNLHEGNGYTIVNLVFNSSMLTSRAHCQMLFTGDKALLANYGP